MGAAPAARIPRCQFPSGRSTFSSPSTVAGGDQRDVRVDEKDGGQPANQRNCRRYLTWAGYCDHRPVQGGERGRLDELARCQPA